MKEHMVTIVSVWNFPNRKDNAHGASLYFLPYPKVHMKIYRRACVCSYVCVGEREREKERGGM